MNSEPKNNPQRNDRKCEKGIVSFGIPRFPAGKRVSNLKFKFIRMFLLIALLLCNTTVHHNSGTF